MDGIIWSFIIQHWCYNGNISLTLLFKKVFNFLWNWSWNISLLSLVLRRLCIYFVLIWLIEMNDQGQMVAIKIKLLECFTSLMRNKEKILTSNIHDYALFLKLRCSIVLDNVNSRLHSTKAPVLHHSCTTR
jgi:hypothetical protein